MSALFGFKAQEEPSGLTVLAGQYRLEPVHCAAAEHGLEASAGRHTVPAGRGLLLTSAQSLVQPPSLPIAVHAPVTMQFELET